MRTKQDFIRVLQRQGIVRKDESEAMWTGAGLEQIDDDALYATASYQALLDLNTTRHLIEKIFAEPVFMYRNVDIRFAFPEDNRHLTPQYGRKVRDLAFAQGATEELFESLLIEMMKGVLKPKRKVSGKCSRS